MNISNEIKNKLYRDYRVVYNEQKQAWLRYRGVWNKSSYELGIVTKLITGENILLKGESYVKYDEHREVGHVCICGCPLCTSLYRLYHKNTNHCFLVGSVCIKRAGHPNFINDMACGRKNGFCKKCNKPLIFRTKRKNSKKSYNGVCQNCRKYKKIYLNIPYRYKDEYKKFGTKWDCDLKLWYVWGYADELPDELKKVIK